MKLFITKVDTMDLVAGKVTDIKSGSGKAEGKVMNVTITGKLWNKEKGAEEDKNLEIAFWNSDEENGSKLAKRIVDAGVKVGSFITALVVIKDEGKAKGLNFKYSGLWKFPATDERKELNVFVGTVASLDDDPNGKFVKISMPVSFKGETEWHRITFWNDEKAALADRAKVCLTPNDGHRAKAIVVCGENVPYNDRPSYKGFRFELIPN